MTQEIFIATELGIRQLEGEELENYLANKAETEASSLQQFTQQVRNERNELLRLCDWTELPSATSRLSIEQLTEWATYRQELRDVPTQEGFPQEINWPTKPTE